MGVTRALRLWVQIGVMGLGAWLVLRSELTTGAMLASAILLSKALAPVEQMVGTWRTIGGSRESWRRAARSAHHGRRRAGTGESAAGHRPSHGRGRGVCTAMAAAFCCAMSASRSSPAIAWSWSGRRAPARARLAGCWPVS